MVQERKPVVHNLVIQQADELTQPLVESVHVPAERTCLEKFCCIIRFVVCSIFVREWSQREALLHIQRKLLKNRIGPGTTDKYQLCMECTS